MPLTIKTRYRDIEHAEVCEDFSPGFRPTPEEWASLRNKSIVIETPGAESRGPWFNCRGPVYRVVQPGDPIYVCSHIAEIGD